MKIYFLLILQFLLANNSEEDYPECSKEEKGNFSTGISTLFRGWNFLDYIESKNEIFITECTKLRHWYDPYLNGTVANSLLPDQVHLIQIEPKGFFYQNFRHLREKDCARKLIGICKDFTAYNQKLPDSETVQAYSNF